MNISSDTNGKKKTATRKNLAKLAEPLYRMYSYRVDDNVRYVTSTSILHLLQSSSISTNNSNFRPLA